MTPMVDIVMVILIFFMASAAFLGSEWFLNAAIPFEKGRGKNAAKANDALELPAVRLDIVLDVDASGQTVGSFLEIKKAPLQNVLDRIAGLPRDEQTRQLEVFIRPTARVPYRDVVAVHSACDAAGIYKVGIGVSKGGEGNSPRTP